MAASIHGPRGGRRSRGLALIVGACLLLAVVFMVQVYQGVGTEGSAARRGLPIAYAQEQPQVAVPWPAPFFGSRLMGEGSTAEGQIYGRAYSPPACGLAWRAVPSENIGEGPNDLAGIAVLSPRNIWVAGGHDGAGGVPAHTLIEHWDGSLWSIVPSPDGGTRFNYLTDLAAPAPDDIWAVGYYGDDASLINPLIEHWNGTQWSLVLTPDLAGAGWLISISAASATDIWAAGWRGLIVHWDGTRWSRVPSPGTGLRAYLFGVAAISASDVWVSGEYFQNGLQQTLTEHWDGSQWSIVPSPNVGQNGNQFYRVNGRAANDVWAVGQSLAPFGVARTLVEHWDGVQWNIVPSPNVDGPNGDFYSNTLVGVKALSSTDVWAVGAHNIGPFGYSPQETLIEHWDGAEWSVVDSPASDYGSSDLIGLAASSQTDVWAVGFSANTNGVDQTLVARYSDPCATPTPTATATATATPTPNGCSVCNLSVQRVVISCNPDGTVHWTATVRNRARCPVYDGWYAQLQVKLGGDPFATVREQDGIGTFPPGDTVVSGDICYQYSPGTRTVRVEFAPRTDEARCNPHGRSDGIAPCASSGACP